MGKIGIIIVLAFIVSGVLAVSSVIVGAIFQDGVRTFMAEQTSHVSAMNRIAAEKAAEEARLAIEKAERDEAYWRDVDSTLRNAFKGLVWGGFVVLAIGCMWLTMMGLLTARNRRDIITVSGIPVSRQAVLAGATLPMAMVATTGKTMAEIERAKQPVLPTTLRTYNHVPRLTESKPTALPTTNPAAPELNAPPVIIPPFYRLLDEGIIGTSGELALGFEQSGKLISAPLDSLFSIAVAGMPGSGKTNTALWIIGQAVLKGARILVADLHANATGAAGQQTLGGSLIPLRSAFLEPVADTVDAIAGMARNLRSEVEWRKCGGQGEPILFAADEWTALMRSSAHEELAALMEAIGQEGRKFGIFPLLCGQAWTVDRVGGSALRDVLASSFIHRIKPSQARLLAPDLGNEVYRLPVGHAFLNTTDGHTSRIIVPRVTRSDLDRVVDMLPLPSGSGRSDSGSWGGSGTILEPSKPLEPVETPTEPTEIDPAQAPGSTEPTFNWPIEPRTLTNAEAAEARRLYMSGVSKSEICRVFFGYKNGETWELIASALAQ